MAYLLFERYNIILRSGGLVVGDEREFERFGRFVPRHDPASEPPPDPTLDPPVVHRVRSKEELIALVKAAFRAIDRDETEAG